MLAASGLRLTLEAMNRHSNFHRALIGSQVPHDEQRVYARNFEVPSGGAVGTARAIAHAYSVFAIGGCELGLRAETLELLAAPAIPPARGFYDECMKVDGVQFSLGFMKSSRACAVRQCRFVRVPRGRWRSWIFRSEGWGRLRLRDQQNGDTVDRRPARPGAERRALPAIPASSARWRNH